MFAIAFDLVVAETEAVHPKGVSSAYDEIGRTLVDTDFAVSRAAFTPRLKRIWPTSPRP
jgi:virulence-associated protein VapD